MILSWNTTKRCNLYCKHCYRESDENPALNELTTEEGYKLIDEIARTKAFKILILSGGEPLIRPDIEDLARHARTRGLIPVLGTNGTLITKERAKTLKEAGVAAVGISLDSVCPEKHNDFRQTPEAFEKALAGIKNAHDEGIRIQINPTITKDNVDEIDSLIEMAEKLKAGALHPFFLVEAGRGKCMTENALSDEEYFEALKKIMTLQGTSQVELKPTCAPQFMSLAKSMGVKTRFTRGCLAGTSYCCILPSGQVHVCPYLPIEAGHVRDKAFDEIWSESEVFIKLRGQVNYEGLCGTCEDHNICGGCRARAYYKTGDFMTADPMSAHCYKRQEGLDE
ncbi:radical SAM protein [Fusibacter sp. JL216-2]|uniref:radical SAM protein n=1 Tax=Fusibacter sp. JL216-2 TaxID=3071453 RepID=UPI003D34DB31